MSFQIRLQRLAERDLLQAYQWAAEKAPTTATQWLDRFEESLRTLGKNPERCSLSQENKLTESEIRELHVGKLPNVYRVIFTIDGTIVRILRILRAQRQFLKKNQIIESLKDEGQEE